MSSDPHAVDHVGYAVADLADAMARFGELFGVVWSTPVVGARFGFVDATGSSVQWTVDYVLSRPEPDTPRIELLAGGPGTVWHTRRAATVHHVAYAVPNVPRALSQRIADGWQAELRRVDADTGRERFAYLTRPGELRAELVQRSGPSVVTS